MLLFFPPFQLLHLHWSSIAQHVFSSTNCHHTLIVIKFLERGEGSKWDLNARSCIYLFQIWEDLVIMYMCNVCWKFYVLEFIFKSITQKKMYNINCLRFKMCVLQVESNLMSMSPLTKMFKSIINYIKGKLTFDSMIQLVYIALGNFYLLHIFYPFVGCLIVDGWRSLFLWDPCNRCTIFFSRCTNNFL